MVSLLKIKRPADLSIVRRLGRFSCCKDNELFAIAQVFTMIKCLGITVFQPRLKVRTFARTNSYEYGKQRQVQESP